MACDSLYCAWLKVHYPYELYITMLKLYDEKKNTDKISAIISEMKRYKDISLTVGRFGQDNRDWLVDKDNNTISQSLSSIRYMSKQVAKHLYETGKKKFSNFTELLRELQMNTCLDTRQIKILIELGYFRDFGGSKKLMKVYDEFFEGENKITKSTTRSLPLRMETIGKLESELSDEELPIQVRLQSEIDNVGLCLSVDKNLPSNLYFVLEVDSKYGVKVKIYATNRGTSGTIRFRKDAFAKCPVESGDLLTLIKGDQAQRYTYRGGEKVAVPGEKDYWVKEYKVSKAPNRN